jgi:hypothetical protein
MSIPRSALAIVSSVCMLLVSTAAEAGAYATVAPPPSASPSSGLPDGRVYEEVSPPNKHGYQAGLTEFGVQFSLASPDGDAVAYQSKGPAGETDSSGLNENFVAERTSGGWRSRSTTARGLGQNETTSLFLQFPIWIDYSPDLSHLVYDIGGPDVPGAPEKGSANFYLLGSEPLAEPTWLLRDAISPGPFLGEEFPGTELVGMSPDASVVYIADEGRLLPQDASRSGWGLYEYRNGTLSEAGVLPDGNVPPSGSLPAATPGSTHSVFHSHNEGENNPASLDNQLSENGMRVFFVSSGELYVHKIEPDGAEHSVLVSASQVPGHVGEAAPDGAALFKNFAKNSLIEHPSEESAPTYAYASPDGSHVFFQSIDPLTSMAPDGSELKVYDFDVDTGSLEYLPHIALGGIVTAAKDGSSFAFVNGASSPEELDLWTAGPNGGSVSQIVQLPGGGFVGPGRMVDENSVLVFQAQAAIVGFNNVGGEQIYRYSIKANELECVSCPPAGVHPSGDAYLSVVDQNDDTLRFGTASNSTPNEPRGVSSDGKRVFFSSPDPLVGRDTDGSVDTYEWENGSVFLLSSGTSPQGSPFLDNSVSGGDVFLATTGELVHGDNDAGFDVYDARIPRPGDNPPPVAAPCTGDVCQGPPSVPQLLGAPPSATFSGAGNVVEARPADKAKSTPKTLSRAQKLARALSACRKGKSKQKRSACERNARKRYRTAGATAKQNSGRGK